jgi:bifunctional non-homologous end joining protein LigD
MGTRDTGDLRPMKAVSGDLPADDGQWAYEIKWDGMRVLATLTGGRVRLVTSNGKDATARFPELGGLAEALAPVDAVLDGEIVAFDSSGRPDFGRLQHRMHLASPGDIDRLRATVPATYIVFDVLRIDGHDTTGLPYTERRRLLADLVPDGPCWQVPSHRTGDGDALLEAARERGLEGVVAKRLDSRYEPGRRSPAWRKVKVRCRQEFVVGGWWPGEGGRAGTIGSLVVGVHDEPGGPLRYAGKVGTGFSQRELTRLQRLLDERAVTTCPFTPRPPAPVARHANWVEPELVAEIEFGEWTADGVLRHPSYLGLRDDKPATEVVRET